MAGRKNYIAAHPNGVDHVKIVKGGKVPTYATWAFYPENAPHRIDGAGWVQLGYSYQTSLADAKKKALPDFRKNGMKVTATRILPAGI